MHKIKGTHNLKSVCNFKEDVCVTVTIGSGRESGLTGTWTPLSHSCFHWSVITQYSFGLNGSLSGNFIALIKSLRNNSAGASAADRLYMLEILISLTGRGVQDAPPWLDDAIVSSSSEGPMDTASADEPVAAGPNLHLRLLTAPGQDARSLSFLWTLLPRCAILLHQVS